MKTRIALTGFWIVVTIGIVRTAGNFYLAKYSGLSQFVDLAITAIKISLVANFWVFKLSANDGLFGFIRTFLTGLANNYIYQEGKENYERFQLTNDLLKPLLTCEVCVGTNICVWVYAYLSRVDFVFLDFIFLISATGLTTLLTSKTWEKIIN